MIQQEWNFERQNGKSQWGYGQFDLSEIEKYVIDNYFDHNYEADVVNYKTGCCMFHAKEAKSYRYK